MRGKHDILAMCSKNERNIPAYAGKTVLHGVSPAQTPEHPRVCGENKRGVQGAFLPSGTSPRMRGKLHGGEVPHGAKRNIPAYAGKTLIEWPRKALSCGTSPRMRGKRGPHGRAGLGTRNIPAYAGKTEELNCGRFRFKEHPRVCGENFSFFVCVGGAGGTSPRMRGKPPMAIYHTACCRNIPAYAGKTSIQSLNMCLPPEHPRVCGENL